MPHANTCPVQGLKAWWNLSAAERHCGSFADPQEGPPTDDDYMPMLEQNDGDHDNDAPVTIKRTSLSR